MAGYIWCRDCYLYIKTKVYNERGSSLCRRRLASRRRDDNDCWNRVSELNNSSFALSKFYKLAAHTVNCRNSGTWDTLEPLKTQFLFATWTKPPDCFTEFYQIVIKLWSNRYNFFGDGAYIWLEQTKLVVANLKSFSKTINLKQMEGLTWKQSSLLQ